MAISCSSRRKNTSLEHRQSEHGVRRTHVVPSHPSLSFSEFMTSLKSGFQVGRLEELGSTQSSESNMAVVWLHAAFVCSSTIDHVASQCGCGLTILTTTTVTLHQKSGIWESFFIFCLFSAAAPPEGNSLCSGTRRAFYRHLVV